MGANRKRHTNTVEVGSLLKWVVVAIFLCIAGLSYVYLSNQAQKSATDLGKLETALQRLKDRNQEAELTIARLSSHKELQRRLDEGFIKLSPITNDCIVRINEPRQPADEIHAVANAGVGQ